MRVVLLIPDAGPLVSLGRADRLALLLLLRLPIYVVDQVKYEVTQSGRFPDAARIERFVREASLVHVFEAEVGKAASARTTW